MYIVQVNARIKLGYSDSLPLIATPLSQDKRKKLSTQYII